MDVDLQVPENGDDFDSCSLDLEGHRRTRSSFPNVHSHFFCFPHRDAGVVCSETPDVLQLVCTLPDHEGN